MKTTSALIALACFACSAPGALAQDAGLPAPEPPLFEPDDDEADRPLARALAFNRRDVVAQLLENPGSLAAASVMELARDARIPQPDAKVIVEAARNGAELKKLSQLLQLGLPEGKVVPDGLKLKSVNAAQLKQHLQLSDAEVRRFERFRSSAKRVHHYFREVRAVNEARRSGAEAASQTWRKFAKGSTTQKVKVIADFLGLKAEPVSSERANPNRQASELRAAERAGELLAEFRDSRGKIDWKRLSKSEAWSGASGIGQFAFALFLKELAVAAHSGDPDRLGEFLDNLVSVDFLLDYTLFASGARAADVVYGRYVRRMARKGLMQGILRSQLVLAAGLAVPMIARGKFSLDTYLVDVTALGLSATAVKLAVESGKGVFRLVTRGKVVMRAGKLTNVVGWVFTAGETAVVLLLGDTLANKFDRFLDKHRLRGKIKDGQSKLDALLRKINDGEQVTPQAIEEALGELEQAYEGIRTHGNAPLDARINAFRSTLAAHSEAVLEETTENAERERRLAGRDALREMIERDYGSLENYIAQREEAKLDSLEAEVEVEARKFEGQFRDTLEEVYVGRATPEAPAPTSGSRLASYDEETLALLNALDKTTNSEARVLIAQAIERVRFQRALDMNLLDQGLQVGGASQPSAESEEPTVEDPPSAESEIPTVTPTTATEVPPVNGDVPSVETEVPGGGKGLSGQLEGVELDPSWQPEDEQGK